MKKKSLLTILSLLIIIVLSFSLVACSNGNDKTENDVKVKDLKYYFDKNFDNVIKEELDVALQDNNYYPLNYYTSIKESNSKALNKNEIIAEYPDAEFLYKPISSFNYDFQIIGTLDGYQGASGLYLFNEIVYTKNTDKFFEYFIKNNEMLGNRFYYTIGDFIFLTLSKANFSLINLTKEEDNLILDKNGKVMLSLMDKNISTFDVPEGIEYIGVDCIRLSNATNIKLPSTLKRISANAFHNTKIKSIIIPENVTIEAFAFVQCKNLSNVVLPKSLKKLPFMVFSGCTSLNDIKYLGTIEEWNSVQKGNNWNENIIATVVHCTDGDAIIK